MAENEDLTPEFEKFDFPTDELDSGLGEGMPDPTATEPAVEEPSTGKKGKKKKAKKEKKPKAQKSKRRKPPRDRRTKEKTPGTGSGLVVSVFEASPYTVLLAISFFAMAIAVLYIVMQIFEYKGDYKANAAKQSAAAPAATRCIDAPPTYFV